MAKDVGASTIADPVLDDATIAGYETLGPTGPTLVLAWGTDDDRGPERVRLVQRGNLLGRGSAVFGHPIEDPKMSRRHADVRLRGKTWIVEDLGSRNGTRVNGRTLTEAHELEDGDVIRLGGTMFVYRAEAVGAPARGAGARDPDLVGKSDAMVAVEKAIDAVAPHQSSVLVTGETGTGKEVVARSIHQRSKRSGRFVAVNCGAVSEGVLESELFGHKKGAFTGASDHHLGLFRSANEGTLLLDEIGEMPPQLQVKLLRVLEGRKVRPVGSSTEYDVDVRVVAATNRDLIAEVGAGRFRSDLYARLCQWPVHLPPLRERREDVPLLVRHVLRSKGAAGRRVHPALAEALMIHDWPLNVRGLVNVISVALIGESGDAPLEVSPQVADLLEREKALAQAAAAETPADAGADVSGTVTQPAYRKIAPAPKPDALRDALTKAKGSVSAASRELGCSRQQVYRALEQAGWTLEQFRD